MKDEEWERHIKQSLAPDQAPDEKLNQDIIDQLQGRSEIKRNHKPKLSAGLLAAAMLLILSVSAYAAVQLLSPAQVAEQTGRPVLAEAFESKDAIPINQSQSSGDYHFTLHGLVSGAGLVEWESSEEIYPDKTYAVVSITRLDGEPMPHTSDDAYNQDPFFISPVIQGIEPWRVNIATMSGGYSDHVADGVMYRLIECDQVEIFADRGVRLAISSGSPFYNTEAFAYDEMTGVTRAREDYPGSSLLFDLPLDAAKADPDKAEAYLEELLNPAPVQEAGEEDWVRWGNGLREQLREGQSIGETIPESVKEVSYDDEGNLLYAYHDWTVKRPVKEYFLEGQIGFSDRLTINGKDDIYKAIVLHRDENGVITGSIVILDEGDPRQSQ